MILNQAVGRDGDCEAFWDAHWIRSERAGDISPLLFKDFNVTGELKDAVVRISGLGFYRLYINGKRVGDSELDPGQTDYDKMLYYQIHDLKKHLHEGVNRIGVQLGNGWFGQRIVWGTSCYYGEPRVCAQIELDYGNESRESFLTDETWYTAPSGLLSNNIYAGEFFDARLDNPHWAEPGNHLQSQSPAVSASPPGGKMVYQKIPPIRKIESLNPISITEPEQDVLVFDFGQNMAGWVALTVVASTGTVVTMTYAEDLDIYGRIDTSSTGVFATTVEQIDRYVCHGCSEEQWEPAFCYHGFRYVEVFTSNGVVEKDGIKLRAYRLATDIIDDSRFSTRVPQVNAVWDLARKSFESNMHSILSDCPARERCGWLGDAHLVAETLMYAYDAKEFLKKFLVDIDTTRDGGIPWDIAPGKRRCLQGCPDWIAAGVLIPWYMYEFYGDITILKSHLDCMNNIVNYVHSLSQNGIINEGRGDWCPPGMMVNAEQTPPSLLNTLLFAYTSRIMHKVNEVLHIQNKTPYLRWANESLKACIRDYHSYGKGFSSQCIDAMVVDLELASGPVLKDIADDLVSRTLIDGCIQYDVGAFGAKHLFPALSKIGRDDLVYRILTKEDYPGYQDIIKQGATTLWENWEKIRPDAPICVKRSQNHHMHGGYAAWFFKYLAGIQPQRGFKKFTLSPHFRREYGGIICRLQIPEGIIESSWAYNDGVLNWSVKIPDGTQAVIHIPFSGISRILEKRRIITSGRGMKHFQYELAPGSYYFVLLPDED